jgi:cupin fold WbuC family metalloprotein
MRLAENRFDGLTLVRSNVMIGPSAGTVIGPVELNMLVAIAESDPRKTARILLHRDPSALLHEMLIVHFAGRYIQPHINRNSAKSYLMVAGRMTVVHFDDNGEIAEQVALAPPGDPSAEAFVHRWEIPSFHTLLLTSPWVALIETIQGPHLATEYARWAPAPDDGTSADYFAELQRRISARQS